MTDLIPIFQVSEFNELINQHLDLLGEVTVEGELSRIEVKNNRLIFATIKDGYSALDVFGLTHLIPNYHSLDSGMKVEVSGSPGLYKGSGKFRLLARSIKLKGEGSLQQAYEKLKNLLAEQGLFDETRKRPLPPWPEKIGLLTAKDSSAYHDVIKIMTNRMGGLSIYHFPIIVQGLSAPRSILNALSYINDHASEFDLLILCRGGGSLEDLQAFNDEAVARAVFGSQVPIISAVGHEDDWSLTDYTADARASTPSNAAEIAVRNRPDVLLELESQLKFAQLRLSQQLNNHQNRLHQQMAHLVQKMSHPHKRLGTIEAFLKQYQLQLSLKLDQQQQQSISALQTLPRLIQHHLDTARNRLATANELLQVLDYKQVLKRGYSITRDQNGRIITNAHTLKVGEIISTTFAQGSLHSLIQKER